MTINEQRKRETLAGLADQLRYDASTLPELESLLKQAEAAGDEFWINDARIRLQLRREAVRRQRQMLRAGNLVLVRLDRMRKVRESANV